MSAVAADDLARMLRLAVAAWPAFETADIDGWLWRASGGGSKRANSVSALSYRGGDLDASIAQVEALYGARGAPARFQIDDISAPAGLGGVLAARGYAHEEATLTLVKPIREVPAHTCEVTASPTEDWLSVYLSAITPDRREVNRAILDRVPGPRAFILARDGARPVSSGLCVVAGPDAIVECMATMASDRRSGGAGRVLAGIEAWAASQGARNLLLQVVDGNAPAVGLYQKAGYRHAATTRYYVKGS